MREYIQLREAGIQGGIMKTLLAMLILVLNAISMMPARAAWYDLLLEVPKIPPVSQPVAVEAALSANPIAKVVPMGGHFTFTDDNVMALRLVKDNDEEVILKLAGLGLVAVAYNENFNNTNGVFLLVAVDPVTAAETALSFAAYPEVKEVWVKESLYSRIKTLNPAN